MSVLEIILYVGLGLFAIIMVTRTIIKAVKIKKQKKNGTYTENENE